MFFEMSFSRLFVHHEWISTPASRVMAEVCWKSLNLSRGNPNCLHGRTGLVVITFALSVWFGFVGLRADRPTTWAQSSSVTGITGEQHRHFPLTLALRQCDTSIHFCWTAATLLFLLFDALFFLIGGLCAGGDVNHSGRRRHLIVVTSGRRRNECKQLSSDGGETG